MTVHRCPIWVPRKPRVLTRLLHLFSFGCSSFPVVLHVARRLRPDVVLVVAPTLICAPGGLLAAYLSGARSILHLQDLEFDLVFSIKFLPRFVRRAAAWMERILLSRFKAVSAISQQMLQKIRNEKGIRAEASFLFPNWTDINTLFPAPKAKPSDASGTFTVLYSGSIGGKQGLDVLVDAARLLRGDNSIRFLICGEGSALAKIQARARDLTNVEFKPLQTSRMLNEMLNAADLHVIPQIANAADLVMPSKLLNILASGGAVVATADMRTELAETVQAAGGWTCAAGSPSGLAKLIRAVREDGAGLERARKRARRYAEEHFDREQVLMKWTDSLVRHGFISRTNCGNTPQSVPAR